MTKNTTVTVENIPVGRGAFETLIQEGSVYVDKTDLVYELTKSSVKYFLARPRRFGKTLLLTTIESLFKNGLKYFKGLWIESHWTDKTYDTVLLDFSINTRFNSFEEFKADFEERQTLRLQSVGFTRDPSLSFVGDVGRWMRSLPHSSLVMLIDEYDAPLTASLNHPPLFEKIRDYLSDFYLTVKSCEGCLRFFFMTGITKFEHAGIFSGFNPITDISFDPKYGTILGYTEKEIKKYFPNSLKLARKTAGFKNLTGLYAALKNMYDGFCFDMFGKTHVYNPWSVNKFLLSPQLGLLNYWYNSGGQPSLLTRYMRDHELQLLRFDEEGTAVLFEELFDSSDYTEMRPEVLLSQAGYYSIKKSEANGQVLTLGYPNQEMIQSAARLFADSYLKQSREAEVQNRRIGDLLEQNRQEEVIKTINAFIAGWDHLHNPIRSESDCRNAVQLILSGAGLIVTPEKHSILGRSDLEAVYKQQTWVFEFKYQRAGTSIEALLKEAVTQMRSRRYGEASEPFGKVTHIVAVYSESKRRFAIWQIVD